MTVKNIEYSSYVRTVEKTRFTIETSTQAMTYVDRVFAGSYSNNEMSVLPENNFKIDINERTEDIPGILNRADNVADLSNGMVRGSIGNGSFVHAPGLFLDIMYPGAEFIARRLVVSRNPEYGIVSFIKSVLLRKYVEQDQGVIFHAGGVTRKDDGPSFIFTALDNITNNGDNSGKTTAVLSTTLREDANFDFVSNDEITLAKKKGGKIEYLEFPSQITVREGTLTRLHEAGIYPILEEWQDRDKLTGQRTNIITPSNFLMVGSHIARLDTSDMRWCFLDLTPDDSNNNAREISKDNKTKDLIYNAISRRRMSLGSSPLYLGEFADPEPDYDSRVYTAFDALYRSFKSNNVGYYVITGGMNRNKLNTLMKKLD